MGVRDWGRRGEVVWQYRTYSRQFSVGGGYFRGPVSGMKFKTHENFNLCTKSKCEVFESRNRK